MLFLFSFLSFSFLTSHSHSSDKATSPDQNTAVVGTLKANTVFLPSCAFLFPPNAVYCDSVTKSCTPTLGGREDPKCPYNFDGDCSLMLSILGNLYSVSQMQNFCILAWCSGFSILCIQFLRCRIFASYLDAVDFRYFVSSFPDAKFLHLS